MGHTAQVLMEDAVQEPETYFYSSAPSPLFAGAAFHTTVFLNYKIPYSSYPQEHYLINSLQQQTHTFLQYNSSRHFVIQNTPEITLPVPLHSGVIFCVILKNNCWKQIEKCNNQFAAHDLPERYPESTTALLIMMLQIKFPLRPVSISLHLTVRGISKKITYYLSFQSNCSQHPTLGQCCLSDNLPDHLNCW